MDNPQLFFIAAGVIFVLGGLFCYGLNRKINNLIELKEKREKAVIGVIDFLLHVEMTDRRELIRISRGPGKATK